MPLALKSVSRRLPSSYDILTNRIIHGLVNRGLDPSPFFADGIHFRNLPRGKIAQSELHELALLVELVDSLKRLLEGDRMVWRVKVEDIDTVGTQFAQRLICMFFQAVGLMDAWFVRVALRCESQAPVFPFGISCPGFLFASHVHPGGIDFIVALGLKVIEMLGEFVEVRYSGTALLIRACDGVSMVVCLMKGNPTKGHKPKYDSVLGVLRY